LLASGTYPDDHGWGNINSVVVDVSACRLLKYAKALFPPQSIFLILKKKKKKTKENGKAHD